MSPGEVLATLGALGGYFSLRPVGAGDPGWRPLPELLSVTAFAARAERARADLGAADHPRAAASVVHLGLAARLVSPALAAAAHAGVVPDPVRDGWCWRDPGPGEYSIGLGAAEPVPAPDGGELAGLAALAERFADLVIGPVLLPLEDAAGAACGVSRRVLRGNLASALVGVVAALEAAAPGTRARADTLVRALLVRPELAGHGAYERGGGFRRRSCCLYYRLPGGGLCGDCVLRADRR